MKNCLHWYPSPCIKDYKTGLLGNFGRMYGLLTSEACFFLVLRHTSTDDRAPRPYFYTRMRLRLWLP